MSFLLTFFVVFATAVVAVMLSVRKFFLTSDEAGYVFVALNWTLLILATLAFAMIVKFLEGLFVG